MARQTERQSFEKQYEQLKQKRPWVEYEEKRLLYVSQKEEKDETERRLKEAQAENEPARREVDLKKRRLDAKTEEQNDVGCKIVENSKQVTRINNKMQSFSDKMDEVEDKLRRREKEEATRISRYVIGE